MYKLTNKLMEEWARALSMQIWHKPTSHWPKEPAEEQSTKGWCSLFTRKFYYIRMSKREHSL